MRVLVVGGGGREHALCWALARSHEVDRIIACPGNAGTEGLADAVAVQATDVAGVAAVAEREAVDLAVVGPEAPLVAGLADELGSRGVAVFGPNREAARLEGSKAWARALCERHGIPGPRSREFTELGPALEHLDALTPPFVVKADGLAGGKGVTVTEDRAEAARALEDCLVRGAFGPAGSRVLLEEHLEGFEVSAMALTDGTSVLPLALARDHKRALDGDRGPNTGGMGAYSPVPGLSDAQERVIVGEVLARTVGALRAEGIDYRGVVYAGLMMTGDGPKVLEFNARFGDPESQVVLPRLDSELLPLLRACAEGTLGQHRADWSDRACVGVVLASGGYPGPVRTGLPVSGLAKADLLEGVRVFHSGTAARDGRVVTAGGRVLTVTATGNGQEDARSRAYEACSLIRFDGMTFRRDIGTSGSEVA